MNNYFDDDDGFWGRPPADSERTSQIERVRGRTPDRTRTHHVVDRQGPVEQLDDESSMWVEPTSPIATRLGPLGSVDPRILSVGAVALAVVLAVPLFGALGDDGGDALRAIDEQTTTTVATTASPESTAGDVVVVTVATDADLATEVDTDTATDTDRGDASSDLAAETEVDEAADQPSAAPQALRAAPSCSNQYTAEAGDYWLRIADGSGTELDSLLELNEATAETPIYPGSTICLPEATGEPASFSAAGGDGAGGATTQAAQPCTNVYASVGGDYWLRIADAAGLDLDELLALNDATAQTPLYPGSEVCLPAGASGPVPPTTTPPTAPPTTPPPTTVPASTAPPATTAPPTTERPSTTEEATTVPPAPPAPGAIEQIIRTWPDELEEQALRIAWRESNYNPRAQNYCCSGLFQIYYEVHAGWLGELGVNSVEDLYNPQTNATAAYALYQRSGSWAPWAMTAG